jgi:hypothetical protein
MKRISITLAGILAATLALPAVAGPNWTIIRAAHHNTAQQQPHGAQQAPAAEDVLPLDHGPRALSTPWLNKEHEQMLAAEAHNKKSSMFAVHSLFNSSTRS